jgi:uncharacterized protein (TIGR02597 family)
MNVSVRSLPLLILTVAGLMTALTAQESRGQTTVATNPVGYVNITATSGETTAMSIPLQGSAAFTGTVSSVTYASGSSTVTSSSADWTTTYGPFSSNPYIMQMLSGSSTGEYFVIASNTTTSLSVSGTNLTSQIAVGDQFSIVPLDTLGSLFGTNAATTGFNVGTNPATVDNVVLRGAFGWITYYNNGTNWLRQGDGTGSSQNSVPLYPEQGMLIVRQPSSNLVLTVLGNVPTTALQTNLPAGATTFLANRFPVDTSIGGLGLNTYSQWNAGTNPSTCDNLVIRGVFGWLTYYYNGSTWLRQGDGTGSPQSTTDIPTGSSILIVRQSGSTLPLNQALPYTP